MRLNTNKTQVKSDKQSDKFVTYFYNQLMSDNVKVIDDYVYSLFVAGHKKEVAVEAVFNQIVNNPTQIHVLGNLKQNGNMVMFSFKDKDQYKKALSQMA